MIKIDDNEYLELEEVLKMTGMKQASLYEKVRYHCFPQPEKKQIEIKFLRKRNLWKKSDIENYIESTRK